MTSPDEGAAAARVNLIAKLLDLRTFVGALFLIFGVIVTIVGITASEAEIEKAAGVNLALWVGLSMLVLGSIFITWTLLKPPQLPAHHEVTEDDLPEQMRGHGH